MIKSIPLSVPSLKGNEMKYVQEAIESEWISTAGPFVKEFEDKLAQYLHVEKTVTVQSGTAGLHLALIDAGIEPKDEIIVPTLTFIAAVNPIKYLYANPIFIDSSEDLCLDLNKTEDFLVNQCIVVDGVTIHGKTNRTVKAIIVVHIFGNCVDMERLTDLCKKWNLTVIEDATEAMGVQFKSGKYSGQFLGTIGDYGVLSFNGNKIMTTGGGGAVLAKNKDCLNHIQYLSTQAKDDPFFFKHHEIGYNYRLTNIQAAIGLGQLEQLEYFIDKKAWNHHYYEEHLDRNKYTLLSYREDIRTNYWLCSIQIHDGNVVKRDQLIAYLRDKGIESRPIWDLIHLQKPYRDAYHEPIEIAHKCLESIINIPSSSSLSIEDLQYITNQLNLWKEGEI